MPSSESSISRRRMLASVGVLLCTPQVVFARDPAGKTDICIDESGNLGTAAPFVVGALLTANPDQHLRQFSTIRKETGYCLTLRYGSSDEHKGPYAKKLLEYFFAKNDLRFCAFALSSAKNHGLPTNPKIKEITYHDLYRKLLVQCVKKDDNLSLNLKRRTKTGEDRFLHDYLRHNFARIVELNIVRAYQNDLMQFADLLTGCVAAEKTQPDCEIKQTLVESLEKNLSVKSLWDNSLAQHTKFSISLMEK
jgi:uncharacterized protein DUF3800